MQLVDEDEDLVQVRRELAYLFLPQTVAETFTVTHVPQAYLIDFYGPQVTLDDARAAAHVIITLTGTRFAADDAALYRLEDDLHRYVRGTGSLAARMSYEKEFEMALRRMLPDHPLFCFSIANLLATLMTWAFEQALHALRPSDVQKLMGAFYLLLDTVGIDLPVVIED